MGKGRVEARVTETGSSLWLPLQSKKISYLKLLQDLVIAFICIRQIPYAVFDSCQNSIEYKAVVCLYLVAKHGQKAIDIQLYLLPGTEDLLTKCFQSSFLEYCSLHCTSECYQYFLSAKVRVMFPNMNHNISSRLRNGYCWKAVAHAVLPCAVSSSQLLSFIILSVNIFSILWHKIVCLFLLHPAVLSN